MIKNFIGGIAVGIANIIPGVSGGTIMVLLGLFDKLMEAISTIFNFKTSWKEKTKSFVFLFQVMLGVAIGLVLFAKLLEVLFVKFPNQTIFWFVGLILFSIPVLKKQELKDHKISWIYFAIGILIIGLLAYFSPANDEVIVPLEELLAKQLNFPYILLLIGLGMIGGATMIFPGVSGSMVLLVLGYYHLFKGYVANVTTFDLKILIPLCFIALGIGLGIIISAIITNYLLKNFKGQTMSLILGLVLMSGIVIIPLSGYNFMVALTSFLSLLLGGGIVLLFQKWEARK